MQTSLIPLASPASVFAELISIGDNSLGSRYSLHNTVTIIGQSKDCDIRLTTDGVKPIHCIILFSSEGLFLRSFSAEDTLANEGSMSSGALSHGDRLTIGTCQFEISCRAAETPRKVAILEPGYQDQRHELLTNLRAQLTEARARYRQERQEQEKEFTQEIRTLAQTRDEIEVREAEVMNQRDRLLDLRTRFIKRWKKHWGAERAKLLKQAKEVNRHRSSFQRECATFEFQKARFETYRNNEQEKIRKNWEELSEDRAKHQAEQSRRREETEKQRQELEEWDHRLSSEQRQITTGRLQVEQRCARLRVETEGLESRVVDSRAVLVHLEQQREALGLQLRESKSEQADTNEAIQKRPTAVKSPHCANIVPVVEELADQRLTLLEHLEKLVSAREQWRSEQKALADELQALAEKIGQQEADIQHRQQSIVREEERQREYAEEIKRLREELEGRITRHANREMAARSERHRAEVEISSKIQGLERREQAVTELYRRWSDRRKKELASLRNEHARCLELRQRWAETSLAEEQKQLDKLNQRREMAEQALILEHARQEILNSTETPLLAKRKLDRLSQRVHTAIAKTEETTIDQRKKLMSERKELESLFCATLERIEELHTRERTLSDQLAEWEGRQLLLVQRAEGHVRQEGVWRSQREVYQQELRRLQAEIERLTEYLLQNRPEFIPMARAA